MNRNNEERAAKGLTLRLDVDSLAILDLMKDRTGKPKSRIVNEALKMWFADYKKRHKVQGVIN
jgi:predicted DNA-binding protein